MVSWSRNSSHSRRHCQPYFFRTDTVFLYGGDAQAGRPASLTYGAAGRIAAQELEYEGDAAGGAVDRILDDAAGRLARTDAVLREPGVEAACVYDSGGRLVARREEAHNYDGATERS